MNKKAIALPTIMDIIGILLFVVGVIFWFYLFHYSTVVKPGIVYELTDESYHGDQALISTYLNSPVSGTNMAGLITASYHFSNQDDLTLLRNELNSIFNEIYGSAVPVCWKLTAKGNLDAEPRVLVEEPCSNENKMFDSTITLPSYYPGKNLEIRLAVLGYKQNE